MAASSSPTQFQDLVRASLNELERAITDEPKTWTVTTSLPVVPHVAQLNLFSLLLLQGVGVMHRDIYPHRKRLKELLDKSYRTAMDVWQQSTAGESPAAQARQLNDLRRVEPVAKSAVAYAEKHCRIGGLGLGAFGVVDLQAALAALIGRVTSVAGAQLGLESAKTGKAVGPKQARTAMHNLPAAVIGSYVVAKLAASGAAGRRLDAKQVAVASVAVGIGTKLQRPAAPTPPSIKQLRGTLGRLGQHLDSEGL